MSNTPKQYELLQPPGDGISQVKFHKTEDDKLLVSSWDQTVRLYDARRNRLVASHREHKAAVLDIAFGNTCAFSGGLDRRLILWDADYTNAREIGKHNGEISTIEFGHASGLLVSGSWDRSLRIWDCKAPEDAALVRQVDVDERVYSISLENNILAVALAGRKILVYDIRKLESPFETRESSLKYPTRCIRLMPDCQGFVCSSVEGRVAVEYLDGVEKSNYAFKCHRQPAENNVDLVYPVNAIAFHPVHHTFVTGGSDGAVSLWDPDNKKRLKQYQGYPTSVSSLDFNASGSILAVASSYTYEEGEKDHSPDSIWIRPMSENEAKPKHKKA
ncbi:mitotic spindle checkpoint protein Bub3 [Coemansia sp. RSA 1813]|nr:mitotic spindle checkpoint protein Bub3 [Coemansia sp. RSA 1646]KAJ1770096.1 mitotic spindle checkpoint protein Bub3 [Coemansia sp. RSA 1843]KAJ2089866.1 mitotic spindle checkpoint protein Bub3 [Coemansia sp. RSA 986]KAJ2214749.1 mitotic spindle checkpoint protein Bub3 [Coemansia sp. RSA 487]KAJ2569736.1 mitotic spindle checkpoint protein Bub3 [Coemansia sp. RSA 1813]